MQQVLTRHLHAAVLVEHKNGIDAGMVAARVFGGSHGVNLEGAVFVEVDEELRIVGASRDPAARYRMYGHRGEQGNEKDYLCHGTKIALCQTVARGNLVTVGIFRVNGGPAASAGTLRSCPAFI